MVLETFRLPFIGAKSTINQASIACADRTTLPRKVDIRTRMAKVHSEYNIGTPTLPPPNPQGKLRMFIVIIIADLGEVPARAEGAESNQE
jgi:hypothetical protein